MQARLTFPFLLALLFLAAMAGCAVNPVTGRQNFVMMSEADEVHTGQEGDKEVKEEYGVYDLPTLQRYVDQVGQRLARVSHRPNLAYHFTVVDSPEINAFALPGGYIYITRGMLAYLNSEAELAAVLGHEIGHDTARHAVQQYTATMAANIGMTLGSIFVPGLGSAGVQNVMSLLGNALLSGYGREHELEADRLGAEYLARAGYDPRAMIRVIGVLKNQELFDAEVAKQEGRKPRAYHGLFASHPDNDTRLQQVVAEADRFVRPGAEEGRSAFLKHVDGVVYGDSPAQGILRGNTFVHGGLGFALRFPPDWRVQNQATRLLAVGPNSDASLELLLMANPRGTPADFLRQRAPLDPGSELETSPINGLPAAVVTGTRRGRPLEIGAVYLGGKAFILVGAARTPALFSRYRTAISETIASFHTLSEAERRQVRPLTIRTVAARPGDTFASLARRSPLGKNAEGYLRLMNDAYPRGEPKPGQILKIIE